MTAIFPFTVLMLNRTELGSVHVSVSVVVINPQINSTLVRAVMLFA